MYREEVQNNSDSRNKTFFKVMGLFLLIIFAVLLSNYFRNALHIYYTEYVVIALAIVLCALTMYKTTRHFAYVVSNDELMFFRILGRREKLLAQFKMNQIEFYGKYADRPKQKAVTDKMHRGSLEDAKCAVYTRNGKKRLAVFSPSEKLEKMITSNMPKKSL